MPSSLVAGQPLVRVGVAWLDRAMLAPNFLILSRRKPTRWVSTAPQTPSRRNCFMAFGQLFSRYSLQAIGKRFFKRFGGSLRKRFLRQGATRKYVRMESLEDRKLLTAYVWNAAADGDWSVAGNWSPVGVPGNTDTVTFNGTS